MLGQLVSPEIEELIRNRNFIGLKDLCLELPVADISDILLSLPIADQVIFFRLLHKELAADTFEYLDTDTQLNLIKSMADEQVSSIINEMDPDDRTSLFEELPANVVTQLLTLLSPEERKVAQTLLNYPESSVGRLMTTDFISVKENQTVSEVLEFIRENGKNSETLNVIYVVDEQSKLIDDIKIREFLISPLSKKVSELMDHNFIFLSVSENQNKAVELFKKYDRVALPVVDSMGILVGLVTVDDVLDVAEEKATQEIQKFGGVESLEDPYMSVPFLELVKKRAGWLIILFVGEMLTATAMGFFENEISKAVVLALFIPLIISSGGNSGSQAATLIIRAMAVGEVKLSDWWRVMSREVFSGLALGSILGIIGFIRIMIWSLTFHVYGEHWILVGFTVAFSLVGVVLWGTLSGSMLPFALKKFGADPATSSAPFVATLVDVTGLVIYFSIALILMQGTLL